MLTRRPQGSLSISQRSTSAERPLTGLSALIGFVEAAQRENRTNFRTSRSYNMPTLQQCQVSEMPGTDILKFKYTFNKFGKQRTFNIELPLFASLPPKEMRRDAVEYYTEEHPSQHDTYNISYFGIFIKVLYYPIGKGLAVVSSVANALSLVVPQMIRTIMSKGIGMLSSILYFVPMRAYNYGRDYYIKKLNTFFAEAEADIKNNRAAIACDNLEMPSLPFAFYILLHPNFPDNRHLRWRYYYLRALATETWGSNGSDDYELALKFADNPDEKILTLKEIINGHESGLIGALHSLQHAHGIERSRHECEVARINSMKWRAPYIAQIPTDAPKYQEIGTAVRAQIQACITSLRNGQFDQAKEQFYQITWDAYRKHAYPDVAIMYYQIEAIIIFFSKREMSILLRSQRNLDYFECLSYGLNNVSMIQRIIDTYYPEKSQAYKETMAAYAETRKAIFEAKEPEPGVSVLPDLYTPMASAARLIHDGLDLDADAAGDPAQSPRSRISGPTA